MLVLLVFILLIFSNSTGHSHGIDYQPLGYKSIAIKFTYSTGEPLSFASFEVFAPSEKIPYQKGRTDRNGVVSFLPNRPGIWKIEVVEDTEHGIHKKTVEFNVSETFNIDSINTRVTDRYLKILTGLSLIMGIFALIMFIKNRKLKS